MADNEDIIRRGRACVRLVEAIEVLVPDERRQKDRTHLLHMSEWAKLGEAYNRTLPRNLSA